MKTNKRLLVLGIFIIGIFLASGVCAAFGEGYGSSGFGSATTSWQYARPSFNTFYSSEDLKTYWPILHDIENDQCEATSDFIVAIRPGGCTPAVVRSDLLEEQNVPVFCQLDALRVNPLIKVSSIRSISFKGDYPEGVVGVSFHPARAAIKTYRTLLGSPLLNNIGYVVIILKRNSVEDEMPEWVSGNLTATIYYDADEAYGTGEGDYYLQVMGDSDWQSDYADSGFWYGKGFLRVKSINQGVARIALYTDENNIFREFDLQEGKTSSLMYFPGFYCRAGLKVKLNDIVAPEKQALLSIDGNEIWVRDGSSILNGRCKVRDLAVLPDGTGAIEISCPGQKINLMLQKYGASIELGGEKLEKKLGELVFTGKVEGDKSVERWHLGYIGKIPDNVGGKQENESMIILTDSVSGKDDVKELSQISKALEKTIKSKTQFKDKEEFETQFGKDFVGVFKGRNFKIYYEDDEGEIIEDGKIVSFVFKGIIENVEDKEHAEILEDYFKEGGKVVDKLVEEKGSVKKDTGEAYGEEALFEQIQLARKIGKHKTQKALIENFTEKYPGSSSAEKMRRDLTSLSYFDFEKAYASVFVNNNYHHISVERFKDVSEGEKKVTLKINGRLYSDLQEKEMANVSENEYFVVEKIEPGRVSVVRNYRKKSDDKFKASSAYSIKEDEYKTFDDDTTVFVEDVEVEAVAHVSLIPEIRHTKTDANFTFKIGIEKRGIELSPEKTRKMIKNLNKTIEDWEEIIENLGNVVKGWKGACFATSSLLMLKNLVSGFDGGSLARSKVMKSYKAKCDKEFPGMSHTECYSRLSSEIDADVQAMKTVINNVNSRMDPLVEKHKTSEGLLGLDTHIVNQRKYVADLKKDLGESNTVTFGTPDGQVSYNVGDADTAEQLRAYYMWKEAQSSGREVIKQNAQKELDDAWRSVWIRKKASAARDSVKQTYGFDVGQIENMNTRAKTVFWGGSKLGEQGLQGLTPWGDDLTGLSKETKIQAIRHTDGKNYLVTLEEMERGNLRVDRIYGLDGSNVGDKKRKEIIKSYTFATGGECSNSYKTPILKYYESGRNRGYPAIVPFDLKEGWYAMVPNSAGTFLEGVQGYKESGDVSYFKICNVGADHVENAGSWPDDLCQSFDINNYNRVDTFIPCPGLSPSKVKGLAERARQAIREAQHQYGQRSVSIFGQNIEVGAPMSDTGDFECQDFMSPDDCVTLFNVCDPVICPTSRCDLGGTLKVANVVQTGIIGSLVLCFPNFGSPSEGGVLVPICLTGVHAGLDSYVSILKSERDCLQHSLETGEHVGICDEITSIYLCEFFWRQLAPVINVLIPKMIEMAYGAQYVRGGGEYLTVMHSWDNLQKSIDYFRDSYAQNAFRAFSYRSVEEAGFEFCRMFVGTSLPTSADVLDSLLAPESPTQFYAWFSERTFSEATIPATSHYKVYYHIYAGNDKGAYYRVYMKDPPASSYYMVSPIVNVETGYIAKGESVDNAIDFTAPEGYKQLCVMIDAQEYCGFKQVSTDFGLEYIRKKYIEEQAKTLDITSEKTCISGTPSAWPVINPNIQAGAEEAVLPEISLRGIVRICATHNPGITTEGGNASRWVDVGYCEDPQLRCWLDTKSVEKDLREIDAIEGTLSDLDKEKEKLDQTRKGYEQVKRELDALREKIKNLNLGVGILKEQSNLKNYIEGQISDVIMRLDNIVEPKEGGSYVDQDVAEALSLKAGVYRIVVEGLDNMKIEKVGKVEVDALKKEGGAEELTEEEKVEQLREVYSDMESEIDAMVEVGLNADEIAGRLETGDFGGEIDNGIESAEETGYRIVDSEIYYNGKSLALFIEGEGEGGYIIRKKNWWNILGGGKIVGSIDSDGKVDFMNPSAEDESLRDHMFELEKERYGFDGEGLVYYSP